MRADTGSRYTLHLYANKNPLFYSLEKLNKLSAPDGVVTLTGCGLGLNVIPSVVVVAHGSHGDGVVKAVVDVVVDDVVVLVVGISSETIANEIIHINT